MDFNKVELKSTPNLSDLNKFSFQVLDNIGDMIFVLELDTAKVVYANQVATKRLGYTLEELQKTHIETWRRPLQGSESFKDHLELVKKGLRSVSYGIVTCKDGSEFPVETQIRCITIDGIDYNIASARDISAILQTRENLSLLQNALDMIDDAAYMTDIEGNLVYVNQAAARYTGYTKEELLVLNIGGVDPNYDPNQLPQMLIRLEKGPIRIESVHKRKDNLTYHVEVNINLIHSGKNKFFLGIARDITQTKQYQLSLEASSNRYHAILNSTQDGFWRVDAQGIIKQVNDAYCAMSGYSKTELEGMPIAHIEIHHDKNKVIETIEHIKKVGHHLFESQHRTKNGSIFFVEVSVSYADIEGGSFYALIRNITRRKIQNSLDKLRAELTENISTHHDKSTLLRIIIDKAEEFTQSQIAFFHMVDEDQETISLQTWSNRTLQELCSTEVDDRHYPISQAGVWANCIHQRHSIICNDYNALEPKNGLPEGHSPVHKFISVPFFHNNQIVAIMGVGNKPYNYNEQDVQIVHKFCELAYDVSIRFELNAKLQHMAFHDVLTGLPNRALLIENLAHACAVNKNFIAICYLDLDHFKPINDRYGHHVGDMLLKELAVRLQNILREDDIIARLGGDEFVLIFSDLQKINQIDKIAERTLLTIAIPYEIAGHKHHVSGSIGVTIYPTDNSSPEILIRHADQAMYHAKETGKSRYCLFENVAKSHTQNQQSLLQAFTQALKTNQLSLRYQPNINLTNGQIIGFEGLISWNHPKQGLLYPNDFLPEIEGSVLEISLGEWVIKTALDLLAKWKKLGYDYNYTISVNISSVQIQQLAFAEYIEKLATNYDVKLLSRLGIEILEVASIKDTSTAIVVIQRCKALGIQILLDDFGTGYSSLIQFYRLPIDVLKIDQDFVKNMLLNSENLDIVEGILLLSKTWQKPVIAEGVESLEIGLMLLQYGCQYAQGYGIARPMPEAKIKSWVDTWNQNNLWSQLHHASTDKREYYGINIAIYTHKKWFQEVLANLYGASKLPLLEINECEFDKWYRGIGRKIYGTAEIYPFIQAKHHAVHRVAKEIIEHHKQGLKLSDTQLAEFHNANTELLKMLDILKQHKP